MGKSALMLLNSPYPDDIRVRKEINSLSQVVNEIHLICLRRANERTPDIQTFLTIHRIDAGKSNYGLAFWDVIMSTFFVHPVFYRKAKSLIRLHNIKIVHVHDLPLVGTALLLKRHCGVKVIFDMHENYPEALPLWFAWKTGWVVRLKNNLFMNTKRWLHWEKQAVEGSDAIIAVVDEMRANMLRKYSIDPNKVSVVSNTESTDFLHQNLDDRIYEKFKDKFILAYVGGLGPHRGVDTAVTGMAEIKSPQTVMVIVGGGSDAAVAELARQVKALNLSERVFLLGHQPFSKVFSYMKMADVNVIPHKSNAQNENGVPHKLFQSMMTGKPVLVSSCKPLKRIVEAAQAGLVFEAGNPKDFARQVERLQQDTELRKEMGTNGFKAATEGEFSWEKSARALTQLYSTLE
ncbi:MAG: glycosyltransferase family 4 protein [Cyclobacteriaceae bacterium]|nr:glycosyltransferase family 4 protein [Cyclobacteriaceae bacterium]